VILVYHNISIKSKDENTLSFLDFVLQMLKLKIKNTKIVSLNEYDVNSDNVVIAFDDGFHNVLKYAYPILKLFKYHFEIFICDKYVKEANSGNKHFLNIDELKFLVRNGAHLQYHSKSHKNLTAISNNDELECEIICPEDLRKLDKNGFKFFAYPFWVYNDSVINIVKKYYRGARSGNGYADNSEYALDSVKVMENKN